MVLENERGEIELSGETITILGVDDPSFNTDYLFGDSASVVSNTLAEISTEDDGFAVLLSHRPELFDTYVACGVDLALSGHAHGGQFRLPFVGGLVAPNQGLFPKYDSGLYTEGNTNMIRQPRHRKQYSPFRFNNRPEVILIELKATPN